VDFCAAHASLEDGEVILVHVGVVGEIGITAARFGRCTRARVTGLEEGEVLLIHVGVAVVVAGDRAGGEGPQVTGRNPVRVDFVDLPVVRGTDVQAAAVERRARLIALKRGRISRAEVNVVRSGP